MKLSLLVTFLNPKLLVRLRGQTLTVEELAKRMADGRWEGGDPDTTVRALAYTMDLYDQGGALHDRHMGWLERGWFYESLGNGASVILTAPDGRTLCLQGDDAANFLKQIETLPSRDFIQNFMRQYADLLAE